MLFGNGLEKRIHKSYIFDSCIFYLLFIDIFMATSQIPKAKTPTSRKNSVTSSSKKQVTAKKSISSAKKTPATKKTTTSLPVPPTRIHQKKKPFLSKNMILFLIIILLLLWRSTKNHWISFLSNWENNQLIIDKDDDVLFVGKDIILEWTIEKLPNNRYSYTHIITTEQYGKIWIRSSILNLNDITLGSKIQWKVTDFINGLYVVDVEQTLQSGEDVDMSSDTIYFSEPWLLLKDLTAQWFATKSNTNVITLINPTTNAHIVIRYFACDDTQAHNCALFQSSFESTVGVHFTDSYWNKFYKLQDENTWFVNLDQRYGVYIEISNEALLPLFIKNSQFITNTWSKKLLLNSIKTICNTQGLSLKDVVDMSVNTNKTNVISLTIDWTASDFDPMQCMVEIDPKNLTSGTLISMNKKSSSPEPQQPEQIQEQSPVIEQTQEPQASSNTTSSPLTKDNTPQIPLKPWKELTFSTRWLTLLFPTPNISFASRNIVETINGLQCTTATNIVLYANKDSLMINPAITIYYCKSWTPTNISNTRVITANNMTLLIQVKDPAWVDFANAIVVN